LALWLAFGGGWAAAEDECGPNNYFTEHPGPLNGRTGVDPCDPYAPASVGAPASEAGDAGDTAAAKALVTEETGSGWEIPPMPGLPGRPY
jgi:hypothetical protein